MEKIHKPPTCARDFRQSAWTHLGQGAWGCSIGGYVFNQLVLVMVFFLLFFAELALARHFRLNEVVRWSLEGGFTFVRIEDVDTLTRTCTGVAVMSFLALPFFYFLGAFRYGVTAMAIAVMRHGARFGHALSGYGRGWRATWLMALAGMYVFFWSLLFVVPGIRAAYSYRMIFYLAVDRPELPAEKILKESKRLMDGRRWALFCLDVSFLGWYLISFVTKNLADAFVKPYHFTAVATFYEDLLDRDEAGELLQEDDA